MKHITIKLTKAGARSRTFTILDQSENIIDSGVLREDLINGKTYSVEDSVSGIKIQAEGNCSAFKFKDLGTPINSSILANTKFENNITGCLWRHLVDVSKYNYFYGKTHPFILEYPYSYEFQDEILQSIKSYDKVYRYTLEETGVFDVNNKIEVGDAYYNKLIIYNNEQNTGLLELVKKPKNNLSQYMSYPIYKESSKVITYTKSDSFYNVNSFFNVLKDVNLRMFNNSCKALSFDKELNQENMDYSKRSFKKDPLRAKYSKVRYILDDRSDIHIVSKINYQNIMNSYK